MAAASDAYAHVPTNGYFDDIPGSLSPASADQQLSSSESSLSQQQQPQKRFDGLGSGTLAVRATSSAGNSLSSTSISGLGGVGAAAIMPVDMYKPIVRTLPSESPDPTAHAPGSC